MFPMIQADPKAAVKLDHLLSILNPALEANSITNPKFSDVKYSLNNLTESLFFCNGLYYNSDLWFTSSSQANNRFKQASKKDPGRRSPADITFMNAIKEIQVLHEAIQSLKANVVKRVVRSEEERAEDYVPPIPTTESAIKINDILKKMTDPLTVEYAKILENSFVELVNHRMNTPRTRKDRPTMADMLLNTVGNNWDSFTGNYTSLKADWKETLASKAKVDADFAQRSFLYKNVMKLATIFENKGNFEGNYVIHNGTVNSAGFQGEIVFSFADGSSFVVKNKVVSKYSVHGKGFLQFPTTFHAAVLPNGTVMPGQPSEQEMIEVFSKELI